MLGTTLYGNGGNGAYLMYGKNSAGVGVGGSYSVTAEECSEVARKERWEREGHLALVLSTKPAEVVQEACQVLEKHGCHVEKLKSGLYYSSTL